MKYEEYEMPEDYKRNLEKFAEMLKQREEYTKIIPTLPEEDRRAAAPHIQKFDKSLDSMEKQLAEEYDTHQARGRDVDEKREALIEQMVKIFIVAKHRFEPEKFKEYEKHTTRNWDDEFKIFFYERVELRESYDLHNILAELRPKDGSPRYKPPMKMPHIQVKEAHYEINLLVYEQPEDFKEMLTEFENTLLKQRKAAANRIKFANPRRHSLMKSKLAQLDQMIEEFKPKLWEFLNICLKEDGKIEIENPDQKKLDAAFEKAEVASERNFIMIKHTIPHLLEGYTEICLSVYDKPEEIAEFYERIAKREAEELDEILRSVGAIS